MRESFSRVRAEFVGVMLRLQCCRLKESRVQEDYRVFLQGKVSQMCSAVYV